MTLVLEFGSRSGSWFALAFFVVIFATLGRAVLHEVRRRSSGRHSTLGRLLGLTVFLGPILLIYASMLSGFYEAEVSGDTIELRYLVPGVVAEVPATLATARIAPAYRDRVRLVVTAGDRQYESTPWRRAEVEASLKRFNETLAHPSR